MMYPKQYRVAYHSYCISTVGMIALLGTALMACPHHAFAGEVQLRAQPAGSVEVGSQNRVTILSNVARDSQNNNIIEPGSLVEIKTTRGIIMTGDAAPQLAGRHVNACGGVVAFSIAAPRQAGLAEITVLQDGAVLGSLSYEFLPGPPAPPIRYGLDHPQEEGTGAFRSVLRSELIGDRYGNPVQDTTLYVRVENASLASDVLAIEDGHGALDIEVNELDTTFRVFTYEDPEQTVLLDSQTLSLADYVRVPDVVGMPRADAEAAIRGAWLTLGEIKEQYHDTTPEGCVTSTNPAAGARPGVGGAVDLTVSLGPHPDERRDPDSDPMPDPDPSPDPMPDPERGGAHGPALKMLQQDVYEKALPNISDELAKSGGDPARVKQAMGHDVYLRLRAKNPIDPETLWASAYDADGEAIYLPVRWRPTVPADDRDGWAVITLPEFVHEGEDLLVETEALIAATGETVNAETVVSVAGLSEGKAVDSEPRIIEDTRVKRLPRMLAGAASPVYRIGPMGVYDEPLTVQLPLARDQQPDDLDIYYYSESADQEGWYRGERVIGWLAPESVQIVEEDGVTYLEFAVNHSGVVQLGRDISPHLGSMGVSSLRITGDPIQWIALLLLLSLGVWAARPGRQVCRVRRERSSKR